MYINYDYYRVFYYVAKHQNFTQAANALANNQPNITRIIKILESELGCQLFVRSNRGVFLTPEGEKFYAHIKIAVEEIQKGETELTRFMNFQSGIVSISASEVALRCFLLPVLKNFQQHYPNIKLRIFNHTTLQAIEILKAGLADFAMVTTPTGNLNSLKSINIKDTKQIAVCGAAFSELSSRTVSLNDISQYPIVSLGLQTKTHEFYTELFMQHGLNFTPSVEASTADQILPMVKNNLGIGFIPQDFLDQENADNVFTLKLNEPIPTRSICFIKRTDQVLNVAAKELERMILNWKE